MSRPLHIGLTGNIASGKSAVASLLAARGAMIIDADVLARQAIEPGTRGHAAVVERFGDSVVASDGTIDRDALRRRVFSNPAERSALNEIIHPIVGSLRDAQLREARERGERIIVSDIPLLFEVGLEHAFDGVIFVDAPEDVRLRRLVGNRGLPETEARAIMATQWPAERKRELATWVIDNSGSREQLVSNVEALWKRLTSNS